VSPREVEDFRSAELRIPADRFPLPPRVREMLRLYSGPGRWEGKVAVFELPVYRVEMIERAFEESEESS
jgi:hypothetical protein